MEYTEYNAGHLTAQPKAADIAIREPQQFVDPPCAGSAPALSAAEAAHFKEHGFLVKRRLLDTAETFAQVIDHFWRNAPPGTLRRDDPASWLEAPREKWTEDVVARVGRLADGNWKMRSPGPAGVGTEPFLVERIANHPHMLAVARAFLGAPVQPARRVRGIYAVLPRPPGAAGGLAPHADYMAAQLAAMVMPHEVRPRCGGFTLWPGSHLLLHPHWDTVHGGRMSAARGEGFRLARDAALRDITPVEFAGDAGDVVFWHPRVLHSAGVNQSGRTDRPAVRLIVPCDYQRAGFTYYDDDEFGPGAKYQWWVDTRNFREDVPPTADNIWDGWAI